MTTKKTLFGIGIVVLVLALLSACGNPAGVNPNYIHNAMIMVTAPAVYETADPVATADPATDRFEISEVTWTRDNSSAWVPSTPFAEGGIYTAEVTLTALGENTFVLGAMLQINGPPTDIVDNNGSYVVLRRTFAPLPAPATINAVYLTITAPVTGAAPQLTIIGENYNATIAWTSGSSTEVGNVFAAYTVYTATITLTAHGAYIFYENLHVNVSNQAGTAITPASVDVYPRRTATVILPAFDRTAEGFIYSANVTASQPVTGGLPTFSATGNGFTAGTVQWTRSNNQPFDTSFSPEMAYTAVVTLTANTGYSFAEDFFIVPTIPANVTHNTVVAEDGNTVTITVGAFPETARLRLYLPAIGNLNFAIGHIAGGGASEGLTALTPILTPGRNERTVQFTVAVREFTSEASSAGVYLHFTNHPGLYFMDGYTAGAESVVWNAATRTSTFTVWAMYDGTTAVPVGQWNIGVYVRGHAHGYYSDNVAVTLTIPVRDGQESTAARAIPVSGLNFGAFRTFAGDTNAALTHAGTQVDAAAGRDMHYWVAGDFNFNFQQNLANIPAHSFRGSFDGRGYVINLPSPGFNQRALFGYVTDSGVIRNLGIRGTVNAGGANYAGGIAGSLLRGGTIENSFFQGTVNANSNNVGGIAGRVGGTGPDDGIGHIRNSYFIGTVNGNNGVGGIVGYARGNGSTIENNFVRGYINAHQAAGIVGNAQSTPTGIRNNVVLLTRITRTGGEATHSFGRIWGHPETDAQNLANRTNNYAASALEFNNVQVLTDIGSGVNSNGAAVTPTEYNSQDWWANTTGFPNGPGFAFGAGLWRWSPTLNRPWLGYTAPASN